MTSLRNSIHRRNHKERSQLSHRAKLGLLEKHADYVKRARDYHSKQDRLTRLKQKAAERNKDEFYFSMTHERTKDGVHVKDRGNAALPTDMVKVLKTQDENYIRTMRASGRKKIDKIKNSLMEMADLLHPTEEDSIHADLDENELKILRDAKIIPNSLKSSKKRNHLLFAETSGEGSLGFIIDVSSFPDTSFQASRLSAKGKGKEIESFDVNAPMEEMDLGWKSIERKKKLKRKSSNADVAIAESISSQETNDHDVEKRRKLLKELAARLERDQQLRYTEREFEMQRQLMGKGSRKKIKGVEKVEGDDDDDEGEDEDEIDARRGKRRPPSTRQVDEATYRPRVYKWRLERKR